MPIQEKILRGQVSHIDSSRMLVIDSPLYEMHFIHSKCIKNPYETKEFFS